MDKFIKIKKEKPVKKIIKSKKDNIDVTYMPNLLDDNTSSKYFRILEKKLIYNSAKDSTIKIFGKSIKIPREQVAYGDHGIYYEFSGAKINARSWSITDAINSSSTLNTDQVLNNILICKILQNIKKKVEEFTGKKFNFVLINRYKDGNSYIGWHADDEKQLGDRPYVVGVSLGEPRDFQLKPKDFVPKDFKSAELPINIKLESGSIVVMEHPTNDSWKHSVPKRSRVKNPRISLTFRMMN